MAEAVSKKVTLDVDVTVNGIRYRAGEQEVPAEQAEDIQRINNDYLRYEAQLHRDNGQQVNAGAIRGGGN